MPSRKRSLTDVAITPVTGPGAPPALRKVMVHGGTAEKPGIVSMWREGTRCDARPGREYDSCSKRWGGGARGSGGSVWVHAAQPRGVAPQEVAGAPHFVQNPCIT